MPAVWFTLMKSLQCKSEAADVHDQYGRRSHLSNVLTKKTGRSGCSRSIANLRDVIHGSKRHMEEKPPICSPRSIGSSELLNPITHEVVLRNSTCELKISGPRFSDGNGADSGSEIGCSTFLGTFNPGTPRPGVHHAMPPYKNKGLASPIRSSSSLSRRRSSSFGGLGVKPRHSMGADFQGCTTLTCHKCGEQFLKLEAAEEHHLSKHAVTELVEGDSSRKIVEIICRTKSDNGSAGGIERILKVHNMQKTIAQFEDHREMVKMKASKLQKKHPRCLADGNELLRFHGTTVECPLGTGGASSLCASEKCAVCQILRHGFKAMKELNDDIGVFTASTSSRAFESIQQVSGDHDGNDPPLRKALIVCRVIAGRVHKPLENVQELAGQSGFDSLAGKVGVHSNIEELYLLSTKALLPCFVVVRKS